MKDWGKFVKWVEQEVKKEHGKSILTYFVNSCFENPIHRELYKTKRQDYIFTLLNPEE